MQDTQVLSLGGKDTPVEEMATQSSIVAWRIPWTEEPNSPWGPKSQKHDLAAKPPQPWPSQVDTSN